MNFPDNLKYTKDHEWVRLEGSTATMGITEFAQSELGEIVFADLPAPGKVFKQSDSICVVESTKAASDVYAPVGGTVKESNAALADNPGLVNSSPYDQGWLVRLENVTAAELSSLMDAKAYKEFLGNKI
jgi:glycine cleavage system H protein